MPFIVVVWIYDGKSKAKSNGKKVEKKYCGCVCGLIQKLRCEDVEKWRSCSGARLPLPTNDMQMYRLLILYSLYTIYTDANHFTSENLWFGLNANPVVCELNKRLGVQMRARPSFIGHLVLCATQKWNQMSCQREATVRHSYTKNVEESKIHIA